MLKRMRWLTLGAGLGAGASLWVQRRLRVLLDRYAPVRGTANVLGTARQLRRDLRIALRDGKRQMQDAEQRLRDERDRRWTERRHRREAA
ncbi:hypothetical protein [Candidatus Poriferisodalis sp.]|uniref:hypothetical protein n=1 Tax=Candidatus Poriferisodalis sp. TaxID=3101277 RepID=UPI003B525031